MQDTLLIEDTGRAGALLHPLRIDVLKRLAEPSSCPEVAKDLTESTQKVYYHVKILEGAGLVNRVGERRVRGIVEGIYQARAKSYWLSPRLVGRIGGGGRARDHLSLGFLLTLAEEIQTDVARLAERAEKETTPSLGLSAEIELRDAGERDALRTEVREFFESLAQKYGRLDSSPEKIGTDIFRLTLVCYPKEENET
ncbi:MAG TPA: helix-turn-helix domain-containing protein [Vicinamibacteria bacterium]|nr:helix-turn-helix domain-containing protein [Vicinamibacteria bacterium]